MTEPDSNEKRESSASTFAVLWSTKRGRWVLGAAVVAGIMIAGLVVGRVFVPPWRTWYFKDLNIAVELPGRPIQTVASPRKGNVAFECRTRDMTVLIAGQRLAPTETPADAAELAERALQAVRAHPEVDDLTARTRSVVINGIPGIELAGSMKRRGAPAIVRGFVALAPPRAWQVLIFFSRQDQQEDATRILHSFRRMEGDNGGGDAG